MSDILIQEVDYYYNLNKYISDTISNKIINCEPIIYDHWLLNFEYKSKNYYIFLYDYADIIDNVYDYVIQLLNTLNIKPEIIARFTGIKNPYATSLLLNYLAIDGKMLKYSKLNKYFNKDNFYKIRIMFIPVIHSMEIAIKLKLIYKDDEFTIINNEDLNKRYSIYIFTKYKKTVSL